MARLKLSRLIAVFAGAAALAVASCGGSSSTGSDGPGSQGGFQLVNISVSNGITWKINRAIRFTFNDTVDFTTVNNNSINIVQASGKPALGTFAKVAGAPNIVEFRPACPTKDDFSDAGLIPGNVRYDVTVLGEKGGLGIAVTSKAGDVLQQSQTRFFFTPDSVLQSDIFQDLDPTQGPVPALDLIDTNGDGIPDVAEQLTYLEQGGDSSGAVPFSSGNVIVDGDGDTILADTQDLNLYSSQASHIAVVLELNQPVNPSSSNISPDRVRLEFRPLTSAVWTPLPTMIDLVANCSETGATIRLEPSGILPQGSKIRVVITTEFEDLVGQRNPQDLSDDFIFVTRSFDNPAFAQGGQSATDLSDELLETFVLSGDQFGSLEDETAPFAVPLAEWGSGHLRASFDFDGDGGPGGNFDLRIPPNTTVPIDTTFDIVNGGPGFTFGSSQAVVNGVLNVRNLRIEAGGVLQATGPNPLIIQATGKVEIFGLIDLNGGPAKDVATLGTGQQPETGAAGVAGGGAGGDASTVTNNATPKGTNGEGAFRVANLGGRGGESAYSGGSNKNSRRPGGGGGGRFAPDISNFFIVDGEDPAVAEEEIRQRLTTHYAENVDDPNGTGNVLVVSPGWGGKATKGRDGNPNGTGAVTNQSPAQGGQPGSGPFFDTSSANDFYGTKNVDNGGVITVIKGELKSPQAGAGGGGAGDAIKSGVYPPKNWKQDEDEKGGGGGGGSGQLQILSLGDIVFGGSGQVQARGGRGASGENTINFDHVGGGGGAGSGGHVILQTPAKIDFSACDTEDVSVGTNPYFAPTMITTVNPRAISAHGGRGAKSGNSNTDNNGTWLGQGAGGDGGPGLIQLHVLDEDDILLPAGVELRLVTEPRPQVLVPTFGGVSKARSRWIALGGASLDPMSPGVPDQVRFFFEGTRVVDPVDVIDTDVDPMTDTFTSTAHGLVNGDVVNATTDGTLPAGLATATDYFVVGATANTFQLSLTMGGFALDITDAGVGTHTFIDPTSGNILATSETVDELTPILSGGSLPPGSVSGSQLTIDGSSLLGTPDDIYLRNANLLRNFGVRLDGADFEVVSASTGDATGGLFTDLVLTLDAAPPANPSAFEVIPRYFRVVTSDQPDMLPAAAHIKLEFQGTSVDASGNPVIPPTGTDFLVPWTSDIDAFNQALMGEVGFFRFRVEFDIGDNLSSNTPTPELNFLRIPFLF